jgi:hypothetical protein
MASKGKKKENQYRSVAGFRAFTIERRTEDDVPEYLMGAATWLEIRHEEGYWIFDAITTEYHAAEYDEIQDQWYFVRQDPRTRQWVAVAPVPANYNTGRRVKPTNIRAADVDDSNAPESSTSGQRNVPTQSLGQHNVPTTQSLGQHNVPTVNPFDIHRIGMTTQTLSTATAASALAGQTAPGQVHQFLQPKKKNTGKTSGTPGAGASGGPPGSGPPAGSGPPHATGPPGGGGAGGGGGAASGGGRGNGKLGGNPPKEFNGERSKANAFMNQFNLYRLSNYDAEQMVVPMKRATLLLGFIKGSLVDDWVKRWTQWAINQFSIDHRPPTDEYYWTEISNGFQIAFQDTGARERAEKELHMLRWDPESVDTFLARFESLAEAADFELDANPTKSILAKKLPFNMVDHLYKVVKPGTYPEFCEAIRQFHADNTAVQNLKGHQDKGALYTKGQDGLYMKGQEGLYTKKDRKNLLGGYTANEWVKILGIDQSKIEMPRRSDAMDTSARSRSKFQRTKGRTGTTKPDPDTQRKEGRCFHCNKQGHESQNCPNRRDPNSKKKKTPSKGRAAKAKTSTSSASSSDAGVSSSEEEESDRAVDSFLKKAKALKTKNQLHILQMAIEAERGKKVDLGDEEDFLRKMPPAAWARIFGITSVYGCKKYGLMKMPVLVQNTHSRAKKQVIVDSGATSNFISNKLLRKMKIGKRNLPKPRTIWLMHGKRNEERHITEYVDLLVRCGDKSKELRFLVTDLGEEEIVVGYPWLKVFRPKIDWKNTTLDEEMHPLVISTTGRKIDAEVEGIKEAWTRRARTMATSSKATHITRSEERRLRRTSASTQAAVKMLPKEEKTRGKEAPPQRNCGKKASLKDKVDDIPRKQPRDTTKKTLASTPGKVKMSPKEKGARDKVVPPRCNRGKKVLVSPKDNVDEIPRKQPRDTTQKILASTPGAVKMSPKEEGTRDKVVPPRRQRGKKVLTSQGNAEEIPRTQPRDTAEDTLASTPVAVKMSPKEEGARDKVVPPRCDSGKKVLASQGTAEEIPRTQPRDTAQKTSASTQEGVKMLPKEKGARNKVISPPLQWKKALSQEEEATRVPRSQPEDIAMDLAADAQECKKDPLNVCTRPAEEESDRKPWVVLPPRCFKRAEALIAGHEDAHPTDGTEERRYLVEVDPETHQPSTELAGSDQQEDDRMDRIVVARDNNLKGGVIPSHDTPKQENPGISNRQDAKQFVKGSAAEERPLKPAKIPITREQIPITTEQLFRFLTAAMDLLIQWLTVGINTPGQETTNPQMRYKFPGFGPPRKAITARRTRFAFQQTREQWQATKILACNLWPSARTKRPCEEVTRGSPPQTEGRTKKSPVPKEAARLADLEEIRSDTLRQTDKAQKVITTELPQAEWKTKKSPVPKEAARLAGLEETRRNTLCRTDGAQKVMKIGHQGNARFKPYDKGDLEWVVGTNPKIIYPTAKLGPQQGLFEVLKQWSNAVYQVKILRQWKNHNMFQVNLIVPDMETELHGPNFTQLMRRTISTKSRRRSTRREDARHRRGTLRVRTRESRQMNTWTNSNEAELGESNNKRTTSSIRKNIPQLVCFSPSNIYFLLLRTMSTVSTPTDIHAAPAPPTPPQSVVSAPDNTPEPLSPQLARRSLPIREDEEEETPQLARRSLPIREDEEESAVNDDRAEEQLTELTAPVGYIPNIPDSKHFYPIYVTTKKYRKEGTGPRIVIAPFIKYDPDYTYVFGTEGEGCEIRNVPVQVGRRAQHYERMTRAKWRDLRRGDIWEFAINEALEDLGDIRLKGELNRFRGLADQKETVADLLKDALSRVNEITREAVVIDRALEGCMKRLEMANAHRELEDRFQWSFPLPTRPRHSPERTPIAPRRGGPTEMPILHEQEKRQRKCYRCKKEDHVVAQCPMKRTQKSCKKCGKAEHRNRKCPKKKTEVEVTASTVESGEIRSDQDPNKMTLLERVALLDRQEWYPDSCRRCGVIDPKHNDLECPLYEHCSRCGGNGAYGYINHHVCYARKNDDEVSLGWSDNDADYDLYWNNGDD